MTTGTISRTAAPMPPKLEEGSATERVQIVAPTSWMKRVEEWRRKRQRIPSKSEAIRQLVDIALEADAKGWPALPTFKSIGLSGLGTLPGAPPLDPDKVKELVRSFKQEGQIWPIVVRPYTERGMGYWILKGRHRVEAARKLKWEGINALVVDDVTMPAEGRP